MPNILKDLTLEEISLVDVPANPLASVPLFKRHTGNDMTEKTDYEALAKKLEGEKEELVKTVDTLNTKVEDLTKSLEEATKVEKKDEFIEIDGEKVAKSAIPELVLKRLEAVEKEKETAEIHKKADELLPNFKGTVEQRAKLLKSIDFDKELMELLTAADALFAQKFEEVGKHDNEDSLKKAADILDEMVTKYQTDKKVTYQQAYAEVAKTEEGRKLILKTYKEE